MTILCKAAPPLAVQKALILLASYQLSLSISGFAGVVADLNLVLHDGFPRRHPPTPPSRNGANRNRCRPSTTTLLCKFVGDASIAPTDILRFRSG
jgi:hypothetical protein